MKAVAPGSFIFQLSARSVFKPCFGLLICFFSENIYLPHLGGRFLRLVYWLFRERVTFVDDGMVILTGNLPAKSNVIAEDFKIEFYERLLARFLPVDYQISINYVEVPLQKYITNELTGFKKIIVVSADMECLEHHLDRDSVVVLHPREYKNRGFEVSANAVRGIACLEEKLLECILMEGAEVFIGRSHTTLFLLNKLPYQCKEKVRVCVTRNSQLGKVFYKCLNQK